mgnify:CR=1 FL=1
MGIEAFKGSNHPIILLMKKNNYDVNDLCRLMRITYPTFRTYLDDPTMLRLRDIILMAGLFKLDYIAFGYLLSRHKSKVRTSIDKWFIDETKKSFKSLEDELNSMSY